MSDAPRADVATMPPVPHGEASPASAVPVRSIAYHDDADVLRPWVDFVRLVAAVGLVAGSASAGRFLIATLPAFGFPALLPFNLGSFVQMALQLAPDALLLVGSIGCLTLRPYGRGFMFAYGVAALLMALVQLGFVIVIGSTRQLGINGSRQALGYVLYFGLHAIQAAALPAVILLLMRRPAVRRIFARA